jgi:predicted transglutaminase-like cysteine proteinase
MVLVCSSLAILMAVACPDQPQAAVAAPAPAIAYDRPVSTIDSTSLKQVAILGAPSRLQQMAMQQAGIAPPVAAAVQDTGLVPAAGDLYQVRPAILESGLLARRGFGWTPASPDRPDIFGTSAVAVSHTSLDAKWRRVSASFSSAVPISHQLLPAVQGESALAKLELVNGWVNHRIQFTSDFQTSGQADRWSGAAETLSRGQGDCEDYAITKLQLLRALGFSDRDLYLSVVRDLVRRADHAVLVVRVEGRFVVLDNNVDRVLDTSEVSDYRPVITYAASGQAWMHGYRQPVVQLASMDAKPLAPAAN